MEASMGQGACRVCLTMVLGALLVFGCGSSNEVGQRYTSFMSIEDNGTETLTIDAVQNLCGDVDDPTLEPFTDVFAIFTITASPDALGLTLESYSIEYLPVYTPDGTGRVVLPPSLISPGIGYDNFDVGPGQTNTLEIVCLDVDTKEEFVTKLNADPNLNDLIIAQYIIRIHFHFKDTANSSRTITVDRKVNIGPYNNC